MKMSREAFYLRSLEKFLGTQSLRNPLTFSPALPWPSATAKKLSPLSTIRLS